MRWGQLLRKIESAWPLADAASWDKVGLLLGSSEDEVQRILVALDVTHAVVDEASEINADAIVTHHPLLFRPLDRLNSSRHPDRLLMECVRRKINLCALHTNLDVADEGPTREIARRLGLNDVRWLETTRRDNQQLLVLHLPATICRELTDSLQQSAIECRIRQGSDSICELGMPFHEERQGLVRLEIEFFGTQQTAVFKVLDSHFPHGRPPYEQLTGQGSRPVRGSGVLGQLSAEMPAAGFARLVADILGVQTTRWVDGGRGVKTVAIVSGSGTSLLAAAQRAGAEALITGDVGYHSAVEAGELGITLVDAGHWGTEHLAREQIAERLTRWGDGELTVSVSLREFDPFKGV